MSRQKCVMKSMHYRKISINLTIPLLSVSIYRERPLCCAWINYIGIDMCFSTLAEYGFPILPNGDWTLLLDDYIILFWLCLSVTLSYCLYTWHWDCSIMICWLVDLWEIQRWIAVPLPNSMMHICTFSEVFSSGIDR